MKFKVGDKVKLIRGTRYCKNEKQCQFKGVGEITNIDENDRGCEFSVYCEKEDYHNCYTESDLELFFEKPDDDNEFEFGFENENKIIMNYKKFLNEIANVMPNYQAAENEPPHQLQMQQGETDTVSTADYAQKDGMFNDIQEYLKQIIQQKMGKKDPNEIQKISDNFMNIGKNAEIRKIVDGCKNARNCADDIYNKYYKNVQVNFTAKDTVNDVPNRMMEYGSFQLNENNFKVGDKVRCISPIPGIIDGNTIFKITSVNDDDTINIDYIYGVFGFKNHNWNSKRFRLYEPAIPDDDSQFEDGFLDEEYSYKKNKFEVGNRIKIKNNKFLTDVEKKLIGQKGTIMHFLNSKYMMIKLDNENLLDFKSNVSTRYINNEKVKVWTAHIGMVQLVNDEPDDDSQFEDDFEILDESVKLNGKYGFYMFMEVMDVLHKRFTASSDYLQIGNYLYFYTSDRIKNKYELIELTENKKSLDVLYATLKEIPDKALCFYFGIQNNLLEYGLYDEFAKNIYKVGEFPITNQVIRRLDNFKCLSLIKKRLEKTDIGKVSLLHQIKKDFINFLPEYPANINLTMESIMKKEISKDNLRNQMTDERNLFRIFNEWSASYPWSKRVDCYVDQEDNEQNVVFYIKIKDNKFKFDGLTPHFHIDDLERYYEVQDDDNQFEDDFVDEEYNYKEKEFEVGDKVRINCPVSECGDWSNKTGVIYKIERNRYWVKRDDNGETGNTSDPNILQLIDEVQDDSQFEEGFELDEGKINEGKFDLTETPFKVGDSFVVKRVDGIDQYGLRNKMGKVCFVSDKFYSLDFDEPIEGYVGKHVPGSKKGHGLWIFIKGSKYLIEKFVEDDSDFEFDFDPLNEEYDYKENKFQVGDRVRIKESLQNGMSFDGCNFIYLMLKYRGKEFIIEDISERLGKKLLRYILSDGQKRIGYTWVEPMFDLVDEVQDDSQFEEGFEEEVNENKEILTFGFKKGDKVKVPTKKTIDKQYGSTYPYKKFLTENPSAFELPFWTIMNFNKKGSCDFEELHFVWWPLVDLELYKPDDNSQFEDDFIDEAVKQQKKVNNPAEEAKKQRERYMQDVERTAEKVAKELQRTKGGNPTKHIHRLVWKYNKHFSLIKNDVYDKVNSKNGVQSR